MLELLAALVLAAPSPPSGFRESPRLEAVASFIAQRPAQVWCATSLEAWRDTGFGWADGYTINQDVLLPERNCAPLERWQPSSKVGFAFAGALMTLAHEAGHASGTSDEYRAECIGRKRLAAAAILYFGFKPRTAKIRQLVQIAFASSPRGYDPAAC